jgi:prepilin-type N-terminal cleavage/methylation domain-containing protein
MSARRSEAGFTLIELLIVLVLSGFLIVMMASGYGLVVDRWQLIDHRGEAGVTRANAEALVRDLISKAYPGLLGDVGTARIVAFTGSPDQVEFLGPLPERFGAPAIVFYTLSLAPDGSLHLAWRLDQGTKSDTVLVTGVSGRFSYFGPAAPGAAPVWSDQWAGRSNLPDLIRLRIIGEPDLIAAPLVTASIDCRFDPVDGKCR